MNIKNINQLFYILHFILSFQIPVCIFYLLPCSVEPATFQCSTATLGRQFKVFENES